MGTVTNINNLIGRLPVLLIVFVFVAGLQPEFAEAQYNMARKYAAGDGSPKDITEAVEVSRWQQAVSAAHELAARMRSKAGDMAIAADKLRGRASDANQRATVGRIAGRDLFPKIPSGVWRAGEKTVLEYLRDHHLSHVLSARNRSDLAADPKNLVFEPPEWNLARGPNDMGPWEKLRVHIHNAGASLKTARVVSLAQIAKGGVIGALLELPVTATVETMNVANEQKAPGEAVHDAMLTVPGTGLAFGVAKAMLTAASALGLPVGAPVLVPLAVVGGTAYVWVSGERIWQALGDETRAVVMVKLAAVQGKIRDQTSTATNTVYEQIQETIAYVRVKLLDQRGPEAVIHRGLVPPPFNAESARIAGSSPYYAPPMTPVPFPPMLRGGEAIKY